VVFDRVALAFDDSVVLSGISFTLITGHTKLIIGASGAGKSTILKLILGLLRRRGRRVGQRRAGDQLSEAQLMPVRAQVGMVFQEGALFDSLTVAENVGYRLYEETRQPLAEVRRRVEEGARLRGPPAVRRPHALGSVRGQRRRVAIARALCTKPRLLLYDEPTAGLDPITAVSVDEEIIKLRDLESVSSILVTHRLRDAFYVATHRAVRENGAVRIVESIAARRRRRSS